MASAATGCTNNKHEPRQHLDRSLGSESDHELRLLIDDVFRDAQVRQLPDRHEQCHDALLQPEHASIARGAVEHLRADDAPRLSRGEVGIVPDDRTLSEVALEKRLCGQLVSDAAREVLDDELRVVARFLASDAQELVERPAHDRVDGFSRAVRTHVL